MKKHKYRTKIYFLLAFSITWINGFMIVYQSNNGGDKNIINLLLGYMGPFLAFLLLVFFLKEKNIMKDFKSRVFNVKRIKLNYFVFALLLLPLTMYLSILISIVFGEPTTQLAFASEFQVFSGEAILSIIILILVPILEELGWRGYGVDGLVQKHSLLRASLIFGFLWGLWHLPIFFIQGSYQAGLWELSPAYTVNFFAGIFPLVIIMNWLYYKNNRSILLLAIFHVLVNFSAEIFDANQNSKCIFSLLLLVIAIAIIVLDKTNMFTKKLNELN